MVGTFKEDRVSSPLGQNWRFKTEIDRGNCTKSVAPKLLYSLQSQE